MDFLTDVIGSGRFLWIILGFSACFLSVSGSIETKWLKIELATLLRQIAMFGLGLGLILLSILEPFFSNWIESSPYKLDGSWEVALIKSDLTRRSGVASIQDIGKSYFQANGTVESTSTPPAMSFGIECVVRNGEIFGVFKNARSEFGVVTGYLVGKSPNKFSLVYRDVQDTNGDPRGTLEFTKVASKN